MEFKLTLIGTTLCLLFREYGRPVQYPVTFYSSEMKVLGGKHKVKNVGDVIFCLNYSVCTMASQVGIPNNRHFFCKRKILGERNKKFHCLEMVTDADVASCENVLCGSLTLMGWIGFFAF